MQYFLQYRAKMYSILWSPTTSIFLRCERSMRRAGMFLTSSWSEGLVTRCRGEPLVRTFLSSSPARRVRLEQVPSAHTLGTHLRHAPAARTCGRRFLAQPTVQLATTMSLSLPSVPSSAAAPSSPGSAELFDGRMAMTGTPYVQQSLGLTRLMRCMSAIGLAQPPAVNLAKASLIS